jgi:Cytochrome c554 and c-prime
LELLAAAFGVLLSAVLRTSCFLLIAICTAVSAKEPGPAREEDAKFVGAVGCRSSSCHGGAGEKRSQYITWSQKDFHTRAYAILLDARSARIAEAVGILQASSSNRCTVCHSPFQSVGRSRLTATAHPDEGVSCESCHGAAEPWLRGHTRPDWTYATRVSAGMHDLRNLYVRANACVACHQNVESDLLKAGHPELVFELDSQSIDEPKHWREDEPWNGVRNWLTGQAVALREAVWAPDSQTLPSDEAKAQGGALGWLLMRTTEVAPSLPQISSGILKATEATQKSADALARAAAVSNWSETSVRSLLVALAASDSEFQSAKNQSKENLFYRAMRLTLALERLTVALNLSPKIEKELTALRTDVERHYNFDAAVFAEHLRAFRAKLQL